MNLNELTIEQINTFSVQQGATALSKLREESYNAMEENEALLMRILKDNKDTEIGKKYDFASIESIEEYQKRLPVTTYDDYAEYVLRMINNNQSNLMTAYDVDLYCETNGTLGNPKIMPMSSNAIAVQNTYNSGVFNGIKGEELDPSWMKGRAMTLMECKMVEIKDGKKYGALSSIMMSEMKPVLEKISSTPFEALFPVGDTDARYLQARFALAASDITQINATFLSFVAEIMRYIETHWQMLVDDIEKGTINQEIRMPDDVRNNLLAKISPMPERAAELRKIFEEEMHTKIAVKIWKNLKLISGVGTGAFEIYDNKLKERYVDDSVKFFYAGISSTEAMFSVPLGMDIKDSALVPNSIFYEFLPVDANDDFSKIVTLDKVEVGKDYEIIMTNLSGLYRYRMRDCIKVMGMYNNLPLIRFQYRIDQVVDLIDDHTSEIALTKTATDTAKKLGFELVDFSVFADREAMPPKYIYLIEAVNIPDGIELGAIQKCINENLDKYNPELAAQIAKEMCAPADVHLLQEETYMLYRDLMVMKGRNSAQLKPVRIIINELQRRFFFGLVEKEWEA
ncbi:MAG: GH3 auxin-responsive promoter family protein [Ruminococcus sp.]|nr:GH3 auxin-responsive promoter family protein [Ruminococcus sp.]